MLERAQTFDLNPDNPNTEFMKRFMRLSAIPWTVVLGILFLTGVLPLWITLVVLIPLLLSSQVTPLFVRRSQEGKVTISIDGLVTTSRGVITTIPWSDIGSVEVRSANSQTGARVFRLLGIGTDVPYVHVQLLKSLKQNLSKTRIGTSQSGIPTVMKSLAFYLTDPEQFARDANDLRSKFVGL